MSFTAEVKLAAEKMKAKGEEVAKAVIIELYSSTVKSTPVDTGRLQGNWQVTLDVPADGQLARTGPGGALNDIIGTVSKPGLYYLTNNLPYGPRIEFDGWSKTKAPQGMVRINARRVQHVLRKFNR